MTGDAVYLPSRQVDCKLCGRDLLSLVTGLVESKQEERRWTCGKTVCRLKANVRQWESRQGAFQGVPTSNARLTRRAMFEFAAQLAPGLLMKMVTIDHAGPDRDVLHLQRRAVRQSDVRGADDRRPEAIGDLLVLDPQTEGAVPVRRLRRGSRGSRQAEAAPFGCSRPDPAARLLLLFRADGGGVL